MRDGLLLVHGAVADVFQGRLPLLSTGALDTPAAHAAAVFLLHEDGSGDVRGALQRVRGHRLPSIYLKPVVLLADERGAADKLVRLVDAVWHIDTQEEPPPGITASVERLRQRANILQVTAPEGDSQLSFRVLRYMATHGNEFVPFASAENTSGSTYPPLEPFLGEREADGDMAELLQGLEAQRFLTGSFVTKAFACTHCLCAFLNFLEVCPDCGSADLTVDDMVHHFRCGHVAPLGDFGQDEFMVCPKCDRDMRHIGVDYDKPSLTYTCNDCHDRFPDPQITTTCYRCRRTTPPELQIQRTIKAYRISSFGENAATHGLGGMFISVLQEKVKMFDYAVLKDLVAAEAHRMARYEVSKSTLLILSFHGIEQIYLELGKRAREIFEELAVLFRGILRESDLLSARNESLFLALLMETSAAQAERATERLRGSIDQLLRASLHKPPHFETAIHSLEEGMDVDAVVADLLTDGNGAEGVDVP